MTRTQIRKEILQIDIKLLDLLDNSKKLNEKERAKLKEIEEAIDALQLSLRYPKEY